MRRPASMTLAAIGAALLFFSDASPAPVHDAVESADLERLAELLERGADVNAQRDDELRPLHLAADLGNREIAALLIEHGALVDGRGVNGIAPLHLAARAGSADVAELLILNGAEVDARDAGDFTPLHVAAIFGSLDVAELLLDHGADVNAENGQRMTPLNFAAAREHEEVADLLEHRGGVQQQPCMTAEDIEAMNQGTGFRRRFHVQGPLARVFIVLDPLWSMPDFDDVPFRHPDDMARIREQFEVITSAAIDEVIVWRIRRDLGLGAAVPFADGCVVEGYGEPDDLEQLELMHEAYVAIVERGIEHASVRAAIAELLAVQDLAGLSESDEPSSYEPRIDIILDKVRPLLAAGDPESTEE